MRYVIYLFISLFDFKLRPKDEDVILKISVLLKKGLCQFKDEPHKLRLTASV